MKLGVGILFSLLWCFSAQARLPLWQKGLVGIDTGRKLYVEHRVAAPGKHTLFMLNGLTWSTRDWKRFVDAMDEIDPGIGFVLYDMHGMGRTLLEYAPLRESISIEDQIEDLKALRTKLNVSGKSALVGLSYGGALAIAYSAKYPRDFKLAVAMAPFIERLTEQDLIIDSWVVQHRLLFPLDPRSKDELYDHYLRIWIYTTYPFAEPVLLENPFKLEATFRMVQGAKDFTALGQVQRLPSNKLHLIGALDDEFVKADRLEVFWDAVKSKAASFLKLAHTKHKIPSERPEIAASWVHQILQGNPGITKGAVFEGDPILGEARSGDLVIPLEKAGFCETLLRAARGPF
jgi:pimeloyl-ACP methyl ester carboxylesterase